MRVLLSREELFVRFRSGVAEEVFVEVGLMALVLAPLDDEEEIKEFERVVVEERVKARRNRSLNAIVWCYCFLFVGAYSSTQSQLSFCIMFRYRY